MARSGRHVKGSASRGGRLPEGKEDRQTLKSLQGTRTAVRSSVPDDGSALMYELQFSKDGQSTPLRPRWRVILFKGGVSLRALPPPLSLLGWGPCQWTSQVPLPLRHRVISLTAALSLGSMFGRGWDEVRPRRSIRSARAPPVGPGL